VYLLLWVSTLLCSEFKLPGSEIRAFEDLSIQKFAKGYAVTSRAESCVVLVAHDGKVIARYNKAGNGPLELSNPVYLGYYQKQHVVLTQEKFLIWFDDRLIPQKGRSERIDGSFVGSLPLYGIPTNAGWYWIHSGLAFTDLISVVQLTGSGFKRLKTMFPQPLSFKEIEKSPAFLQKLTHTNFQISIHNSKVFRSTLAVPLDKDEYIVDVYNTFKHDPQPDIVLTADIQSLAIFRNNSKCLLGPSIGFNDGFIVTWQGKTNASDKNLTLFADYFSSKGGFLKRLKLESPIFPCLNSAEAFMFKESGDSENLLRFTSVKELQDLLGQ
jgi:hypothetical protein